MVIPINKQGGRATYYYPGDGYCGGTTTSA